MDPILVPTDPVTDMTAPPPSPEVDIDSGSLIIDPQLDIQTPPPAQEIEGENRFSIMEAIGNSFNIGKEQVDQAYRSGFRSVRDDISDEEEIHLLQNETSGDVQYMKQVQAYEEAKGEMGYVGQAFLDAAQSTPAMLQILGEGIVGAAPGALAGAGLGAAAGNLTGVGLALPEEAITVPGGAIFGGQWGFRIGMGQAAFKLSYGQVYQESRLRGVPRTTARLTSLAAGGIMAALEFSELKILGMAGKKAASEIMRNPVIQKTLQSQILQAAKSMGIDIVKEAGIEGAQQLTQQMSLLAASIIEKRDPSQPFEFTQLVGTKEKPGVVDDTVNAFLQALGPSAVMIGASHVAGTTAGVAGKVASKAAAEKLNITNVKELTEVLDRATKAIMDAPETEEDANQFGVTYGEGGKVHITAGAQKTAGEPQLLDATAGPSEAQVAQAEGAAGLQISDAVRGMIQQAKDSGAVPENVNPDQVVEDLGNAIPDEQKTQMQEGLDAIYPQEQQTVEATPIREVPTSPSQIDLKPKTELEVKARQTQINTDLQVIDKELKKVSAQAQKSIKKGQSVTGLNTQVEKLLDARETLKFEQRLLNQGLIGPEDIQNQKGQLKIQKVSQILRETKQLAETNFAKGKRLGEKEAKAAIKNYQKQVGTLVKQSGVDPKTKSKILGKLAEINTQEKFNKYLPEIINQVDKAKRDTAAKVLTAKIEKMLDRNAALQKSGKVPKGKFTAQIQDSLNTYKTFINDPEARDAAIAKMWAELEQQKTNPEHQSTFTDKDYEDFDIAAQLDGFEDFGPAQLEATAESIGKLLTEGKSVAKEKAQARKERAEGLRTQARAAVTKGPAIEQGRTGAFDTAMKAFNQLIAQNKSWENFLHLITEYDKDNTLENILSVHQAKEAEQGSIRNITTVFTEKLQRVLDTHKGEPNIISRITDDSGGGGFGLLNFKYKDQNGNWQNRKYTKADLMSWYAQFYSAEVNNRARNALESTGFTFRDQAGEDSTQAVLENGLSQADKDVATNIVDMFDDYYERVNGWYRERNGVSLPKEPRYFPMVKEGFNQSGKDVLEDEMRQRSLIPRSAIGRTDNSYALAPQNIYDAALRHFSQWEHAMAYDQVTQDINSVFGDGQFRTAVKKRYGDGMYKTARYFIDNFINDTPYNYNLSYGPLDALRRNITFAALALKPIQTLRQMSSMHLYWTELSPLAIVKGMTKTIFDIQKTAETIYSSPIMANRWKNLNQDVRAVSDSNQFAVLKKSRHFSDLAMIWTSLGDNANSIFGGGTLYHAVLEQTGDKEAALEAVVKRTESTQQSGSLDQITHFQGSGQLHRMFAQFMSQQNQLFQLEERATRDYVRDMQSNGIKADHLGYIRKMGSYRLSAALYTALTIGPGLLFLPDLDEDQTQRAFHELIRSAMVGNLNGIFVLGDMVEQASFAANALLFNEKPSNAKEVPWVKPLDSAYGLAKAIIDQNLNNDVTLDELLNPANLDKQTPEEKTLKAAARFGSNFGLPTETLYNEVTGAQNSLEQEDPFGAALAALGLPRSVIEARHPKQKTLSQLLNPENDKTSLFEGVSDLVDSIIQNYKNKNDQPDDDWLEDAKSVDSEEEKKASDELDKQQQDEEDAILKQGEQSNDEPLTIPVSASGD